MIGRLKELAERHGPLVIVCSDKAIADAAEGVELPGGGKLKVIRAGAADMAAAAAALYDAIAGSAPDLWHLDQAELTAAVAGATQRPIGDGWGWNRRAVTTDICPLVAVSLAVWALGTVRLHAQTLQPFALT